MKSKIRKKKQQKKSGIKNIIINNRHIMLARSYNVFKHFFITNGAFGSYMKNIILGFMGAPGFLIPPLIIVYSVLVIFKKNSPDLNLKIVYIFVLILILSALVQAGFYKEDAFVGKSVVSSIKKFYTDGKDLSGGGVLGGLISIPFLLMFKGLGTIIILTSAAIIDIILITNVSIAGVIVKIKNGILGLFDKLENKFKLSDKEIKDELIEDYNEPDIVMNGKNYLSN